MFSDFQYVLYIYKSYVQDVHKRYQQVSAEERCLIFASVRGAEKINDTTVVHFHREVLTKL